MSIQSDANEVLRTVANNTSNRVDYPGLPKNFQSYDYAIEILEYIKERFPSALGEINKGSKSISVHMNLGMKDEINSFLNDGGFKKFQTNKEFKSQIKESTVQHFTTITARDISNAAVGHFDSASHILEKTKDAAQPKENEVKTISPMWAKMTSASSIIIGSGGLVGLITIAKLIYDWYHPIHK